jgi:hypothetical protein
MSRMGLGMRVSWRDVEQVGGQERNDLRHRKNGSIVLLERKKGGHVGKNGTEVERPSPTEVGQLKANTTLWNSLPLLIIALLQFTLSKMEMEEQGDSS